MKFPYAACVKTIESRPTVKKIIILSAKLLPIAVIFLYIGTALFLLFSGSRKLGLFLAVPAFCFMIVTIFRNVFNRIRPYDAIGYSPLIPKKSGAGKSFPSRHTASAWVIACACCYLSPCYGAGMLLVAGFVGASRVLAGVHYLSDVLAGAGVALLCSLLFFLPL